MKSTLSGKSAVLLAFAVIRSAKAPYQPSQATRSPGRKLHVAYGGTKGDVARYHFRGASINHGTERCIGFGSLRVDAAVAAEVVERIQPLGVEAALAGIAALVRFQPSANGSLASGR